MIDSGCNLNYTDTSLLMSHTCRTPQKYTSFGESGIHPLIFLKSLNNVGLQTTWHMTNNFKEFMYMKTKKVRIGNSNH